jgi:hypothetical protein
VKNIIAIQVGTLLVLGCGHTSTEPVAAQPVAAQPVVAQPIVAQPVVVQPVVVQPVVVELPVGQRPFPAPQQPLAPPQPTVGPAATRVSVSSVNLGDFCPEVSAQAAASRFAAGDIAHGGMSHCHVVLHVDGAATRFRVVEATLIGAGGRRLLSLTPSSPQIWQADGYRPWNEQLAGGGGQNVLYSLSNLDWSQVPDSYSRPVRVEVVVEVDGATRTVTSPETVREAMIVT